MAVDLRVSAGRHYGRRRLLGCPRRSDRPSRCQPPTPIRRMEATSIDPSLGSDSLHLLSSFVAVRVAIAAVLSVLQSSCLTHQRNLGNSSSRAGLSAKSVLIRRASGHCFEGTCRRKQRCRSWKGMLQDTTAERQSKTYLKEVDEIEKSEVR